MKHIGTVAGRELRSLFVSPVAYGVLSLFAVLAGLFFVLGVAAFDAWVRQLSQFQAFDQLQELNLSDHLVANFYDSMSVVLLFLIPGITMGLYSAEKTNGTQELLLTSPLTIWDIVLGKFAAGAPSSWRCWSARGGRLPRHPLPLRRPRAGQDGDGAAGDPAGGLDLRCHRRPSPRRSRAARWWPS